jgi:hypothetical protein
MTSALCAHRVFRLCARAGSLASLRIVDVEPAPPTVVSVEWDFGYDSLLLDRSPGVIGVNELDPAELGLSAGLIGRLKALLDRYERVCGHWVQQSMSGAADDTDEERRDMAELQADTRDVAYAVQNELGSFVVVLVDQRALRG